MRTAVKLLLLLSGGAAANPLIPPVTEGLALNLNGRSPGSMSPSQFSGIDASGFHATQATEGAQPALVADAWEGSPALRFDGSADFMSLSGGALDLFRNVSQASVAMVVKTSAFANSAYCYWGNGTDVNFARVAITPVGTSGAIRMQGRREDANGNDLTPSSATGVLLTTRPQIIISVWDWATASRRLYVDGALAVDDASFQNVGATSNTAALAATLMANNDGGAFVNGDLFAFQIWKGKLLSVAEIAAVTAWANTEWKLGL